ncbi:MAG TPA: PKD domain-containing protein [Ferruginibacter sp.]|nr:PKD domain-containing protein [Ferruginibacter sp.]
MKKILFSCLFFLIVSDAFATHIIGGEMRYEYIGPGVAPNSKQYRIRLLMMKGDSPTGAALATQYIIGIFNNDNGAKVLGPVPPFNNWAAVEDFVGTLAVPIIISPCIQPTPVLPYVYKTYSFVVELPNNAAGYTLANQTYSRQNSNNVNANQGATYSCVIPGLNTLPLPQTDNSPAYKLPISAICENSPFTLDFSATDSDGDSLVYSFCDAYNGGLADNANYDNPVGPPYGIVNYTPPYTGSFPMGNQVTINPATGIISGIAPPAGKYVLCVCAAEYRNGVLITIHRKDLIVAVDACVPLTANPNFTPITCDGFTVNFQDNSAGNPDQWFWDFGDPASGPNNTSTLQNPVHTFSDTGIFYVKLKVSILGQCVDSIIRPVRVYPGFLPGFLTTPLCVNTPIQFTDTTYTRYGTVNSWRWDFGVPPPVNDDTSHLQNPVYTYSSPGTYVVELRVTNSMGCDKTYTKDITIADNPALSVFPKDSVYCGLDTLQLNGVGTGTFAWTPPINIINANTATPRVFPTGPTWYYTTLTDVNGCKSRDSLRVIPKFDLTNAIAGPINICEEDTIVLRGTSNYSNVTWQWTPAVSVESPLNDTTRAYPTATTTYTLQTRWGNHCIASKTHTVTVTKLATPNAGPDAFVCSSGGPNAVQLNATGGNTYSWTPTTGLSNPNIPNPVASPVVTTSYIVSVGVTGCPKLRTDTVVVNVGAGPALAVMNDTLICTIDTLQLTSTGTGNFLWSPNYMMSSTTVASPLVSPDVPTWYYVTLTDVIGCKTRDSVFVDVKPGVSLNAGPDTTICQTDGFYLNTVSDGLYYQWTPSTYLDQANVKHPFATPLSTTTYHVRASIGKCFSDDDITIKVVPYPAANAGPDNYICSGLSAQLNASGGSSYVWSPTTFLNNRFIPNPVSVRPTASIQYIVTVRDTLGCPKPVKDTVWVKVYPPVVADAGPPDTSVVLGQQLFLRATGGATYTWTPPTWLNNSAIPNPVSTPQDNIRYIVTATTAEGCIGIDSIFVHVFKVTEDIYVPNAFTPNNDGNNDVLRPILLGMKELNYFRVYNRWGVLMFSTTEKGKGWDGRYNGKAQDPAAFVWVCEAVSYKGVIKKKKGSAILVR